MLTLRGSVLHRPKCVLFFLLDVFVAPFLVSFPNQRLTSLLSQPIENVSKQYASCQSGTARHDLKFKELEFYESSLGPGIPSPRLPFEQHL